MDFEIYLRSLLDARNHAGRALTEHALTVEVLEDDAVLAIRIHPTGFNADEVVFSVEGNTLAFGADAIKAKVAAAIAKRAAEAQVLDSEAMARYELERSEEARVEMARRVQEAEEAKKFVPADAAGELGKSEPSP